MIACSSVSKTPDYNKFDIFLRQAIQNQKQKNVFKPLTCLVELEEALNSKTRKDFEEAGIKILSEAKEIISCEGNIESYEKISLLSYVKKIELSKKYRIND